jgi:putative PIN family toxin of toxin-antitoxin system
MCLTSRSHYHVIYQSLIKGKFNLAISVDIMLEYEEVVQNKYSVATAQSMIALLTELTNVNYVHPHYQWNLIETDADDNKYCDCAIAGQASFIVTEDRHFDVLKTIPFPALSVITIDQFLQMLQSN